MNLEDYTKFCLSCINKRVQCIKSRTFTSGDIPSLEGFKDSEIGRKFLIKGFICAVDELSILLEDEKADSDYFSYDEFSECFKFLN